MVRTILLLFGILLPLSPLASQEATPFELSVARGQFHASGVLVPESGAHIDLIRRQNADISVLVMLNVPGSDDDNDYMRAALQLRQAGFTTIVPSNGLVASGGTDFFLAGAYRVIEPGACIGVHSWEDSGPPPYQAIDLPREHPEHRDFLDYFAAIGVAADFYWFTISAASADEIHWMSPREINRFAMSSVPLPETDSETAVERAARCNERAASSH